MRKIRLCSDPAGGQELRRVHVQLREAARAKAPPWAQMAPAGRPAGALPQARADPAERVGASPRAGRSSSTGTGGSGQLGGRELHRRRDEVRKGGRRAALQRGKAADPAAGAEVVWRPAWKGWIRPADCGRSGHAGARAKAAAGPSASPELSTSSVGGGAGEARESGRGSSGGGGGTKNRRVDRRLLFLRAWEWNLEAHAKCEPK